MVPIVGKYYKVIHGIPSTDRAQWMETGDVVKCIGIYNRVALFERSYKRSSGKMRECFQLKCIERYLKPANIL